MRKIVVCVVSQQFFNPACKIVIIALWVEWSTQNLALLSILCAIYLSRYNLFSFGFKCDILGTYKHNGRENLG